MFEGMENPRKDRGIPALGEEICVDPHSSLAARVQGSSLFVLNQVTALTYPSSQWQPLCTFITQGFAVFLGLSV